MLSALSFGAIAGNYSVQLTRKAQDFYHIDTMSKLNNDWYLITQYCYENVYAEVDSVNYAPYGSNNKIYFKNGKACAIKAIQNIITYQ